MIERVGSIALIPFAEEKTIAVGVDRVGKAVFPAPGCVFDRVNAEAIDAMLLKLLHGGLEIAVDRCVLLVEIGEIEKRVVLQLISVVKIRDVSVVVIVTVRVVGVIAQEASVVVQRAVLSAVVLR